MSLRTVTGLAPVRLVAAVILLWLPLGGVSSPRQTVAPPSPPPSASLDDRITQYLNLGKAFYENPTTQAETVAEFKKALDLKPNSVREQLNYGLALLRAARTQEGIALLEKVQKEDPSIPHTWFNLAIYYKRDGQFDKAIAQFQQLAKLAPSEAITHYNLGTIYKLQGHTQEAEKEFELCRDLNPSLAAPHFQLFNIYRQQKRMDDANRELAIFKERKAAQESVATPEDVEWCEYAEIYEPRAPEAENAKQPVDYAFSSTELAKLESSDGAGLVALDLYHSSKPDLLVYSRAGITVFRGGSQKVEKTGLESVRNVLSVVPGDFNNDGEIDLCVLTMDGAELYENKSGIFTKSAIALPKGTYNAAVWIDFDHDYDLDLILFGKKSVLLRNQGAQGFIEHPFPFVDGEATSAVAFRLKADTKSKDLFATYKDRGAVLYLDELTATYKAQPVDSVPAGATHVSTLDLDNDGNLDITFETLAGTMIARNLGTALATPTLLAPSPVSFADLGNRGYTDYVSPAGVRQNQGSLQFVEPKSVQGLPVARSWTAADFTGDGLTDLAAITNDNRVVLLENKTQTGNAWIEVQIVGVKNLKIPTASEIEVKAGSSYQKKLYTGLPVIFGIDSRKTIDTVRITWPNGLIQNEMNQTVDKHLSFKEAQRLSGSCPLIFTWNGEEFQYITDVLGVAPLGAMSGDGQFFPTDHTEYVPLAGSWLSPRSTPMGSRYEIKLTEELSEVSYFDQVSLVAIDHPAGTEIYSNEKWKAPPFPEFRLYGLTQRVYPIHARTEQGDVTKRLLKRDRVYVDDFTRNYVGVAETHTLDLDFGTAALTNRAFLVLNGWVDWADGSTFLKQAQEKKDLTPPYLQVKDKSGKWVTVIEDMGMPSGKPKTIAVDLTGKFLSSSREVRIVTNLCVFWDEIFMGEDAGTPQTALTTAAPAHSEVHFRGFSPSHIHPERRQPETFEFANPTTTSYWNPTPSNSTGKYTRYGDVTPLTAKVDDMLVVMGSGDELTLQYDPSRFPALKPGWHRDYLLRVEGWAKDRDANTAFSQSVDPLPFHGMSRYPYPANEHYPNDAEHQLYLREYNTRPALLLIRPLAPGRDVAGQPEASPRGMVTE